MDKHQHIPPEDVEEIERFLQHEMAPQEQEAFLARLSSDAGLKQSTDEIRLVFLGVQEAALRGKLAAFHESLNLAAGNETKSRAKWVSLKKVLAAASIIGVLAVAAWLIWGRKSSDERLFADYFRPDAGLVSAMSRSENYLFDRAMVDYKTGNYAAAIKTWRDLQAVKKENDTLHYFLGAAYLAAGETDKAIPHLQKVAALPNSFFFNDTQWYLGLAQLKKGNKKEAAALIEKSSHPKKKALLAKLKT